MGNSSSRNHSRPISEILCLNITTNPTSLVFNKHGRAFSQEVRFQDGKGPEVCFTLNRDTQSKTFENLTPNKSYAYSWRTLTDSGNDWSSFMPKTVNTLPTPVADNVALQRISGPYEVIFSVSEREIGSVENVKVRVFQNNKCLETFELTNSQRIFTLKGLSPATLYTYYWSTRQKGKALPSEEARGEFYTKKLRDLALLFKEEQAMKDEINRHKEFLKSFKPTTGEKYLNGVVLGRIGSGKSSFINSVATALDGKYCVKANAGTSATSLTQEVRYIKLENAPSINLVDIFGLDVTQQDLHTKIIKPLFEGDIRTNFKLSEVEDLVAHNEEFQPTDTGSSKRDLKKMSGILVVVDHQSLDNRELTNQMAMYFTYIQQQGIPFIVVCTQLDTLFPNEDFQVKDIFTSPKVCERLAFFAESMGKTFSPDNVYPFVNYTGQLLQNDLARDLLALTIMSNIASAGATYLKTKADDDEFA